MASFFIIVLRWRAATAFVLLIVCVNVAKFAVNASFRAATRDGDSHCAGRRTARVLRQLLTESLVLALAGGAAALVVGNWAIRILNSSVTHQQVTRIVPFRMGVGVYAFTLAVTLATGVLFGLAPGLESFKRKRTNSKAAGRAQAAARAAGSPTRWW